MKLRASIAAGAACLAIGVPVALAANITGTPNAEVLFGTNRADTINAGAGSDYVNGLRGNDLIRGEDGNDVLSGARGIDWVVGGAGNDVLTGATHPNITLYWVTETMPSAVRRSGVEPTLT